MFIKQLYCVNHSLENVDSTRHNISNLPGEYVFTMRNVIAYSNGKRTLLEIAQKINKPIWELYGIVQRLMEEKILLCVGD